MFSLQRVTELKSATICILRITASFYLDNFTGFKALNVQRNGINYIKPILYSHQYTSAITRGDISKIWMRQSKRRKNLRRLIKKYFKGIKALCGLEEQELTAHSFVKSVREEINCLKFRRLGIYI